jgi:hypothetical protein
MDLPVPVRITGEPGGVGRAWRLRFAQGAFGFSLAMSPDCVGSWQELVDRRFKLLGPHLDVTLTRDGEFVLQYRGGDAETCEAELELRGPATEALPQLRAALEKIKVVSPRADPPDQHAGQAPAS